MSFVRNERVKLVAVALNNVGVATVVTAIVVPSVSFVYHPELATPSLWWLLVGVGWLLVGACFHLMAIATMGRLSQ